MSVPFSLVWSDESGHVLTEASFPISFPGVTATPRHLQVRSNALTLNTYNSLTNVKVYLTGALADVAVVQNTWPALGGTVNPALSGGVDISFDYGRSYTRFDSTHGVVGSPNTYLDLPVEAIGMGGMEGVIGAFDSAHLLVRIIIPPGATQYKIFDLRLALDFDII